MARIVRLETMSHNHFLSALVFICIIGWFCSLSTAGDENLGLRDVLLRESNGMPIQRDVELKRLSEERDDAEVRWQSGEVFFDGKWTAANDVAEIAVSPKMKAYLTRRGDSELDENAHRSLASWCEQNGMQEQSFAHWNAVLDFNGQDPVARTKLGFELVGNTWYSRDDLRNANEMSKQLVRDLHNWTEKIQKYAVAICNKNTSQRAKALDALNAISDPGAIPSLSIMSMQLRGEYARPFIAAIRRQKCKAACMALVKFAIMNPSSVVAEDAIAGVREYRPEFYVLDVLALIEEDAKINQNLVRRFNGDLVLEQVFFRENMDQKSVQVINKVIAMNESRFPQESLVVSRINPTTGIGIANFLIGSIDNPLATRVAQESVVALSARTAEQLKEQNAIKKEFRDRVFSVLRQTTQENPGATAKEWWSWWDRENDTNRDTSKSSDFNSYDSYEDLVYQRSNATVPVVYRSLTFPERHHECLVAGTEIQTRSGLQAIETIRVGDLVLSSDTESGELSFQPVLRTTIRPPVATMKIVTQSQNIQATLGHYWWVAGHGWLRTRELTSGMQLHTASGTEEVRELRPDSQGVRTYNLVVDRNHNYFVSSSRILSNDASDLRATLMKVPGLRTTGSRELK